MYNIEIKDDRDNVKFISASSIDIKYVEENGLMVLYMDIFEATNNSNCIAQYRLWADLKGGRETDLEEIRGFILRQLQDQKLQLEEYLDRDYLYIRDNHSGNRRQFSARRITK